MQLSWSRLASQALIVLAPALASLTLPGALPAPAAALPDSILARAGARTISTGEFLRQWTRLGSQIVDQDATVAMQKREFLDQLIDREVLAQAALAAGFTPSPEQEARLGALRQSMMRRAYYREAVLDSLPEGDPEQRMEAEREAYRKLVDRLMGPLQTTYVDSNLVFLARGFADLPGSIEQGDGYVRMQMGLEFPEMPPADSARVLATSTAGDFTIGRFWWHWAQVNPVQRANPVTPEQVTWWVERFLVQGPMDAEARSQGLDRLPEIEEVIARQRDGFAAEWYYSEHIMVAVDTSEAALRAHWEEDPKRYYGTPNYLHVRAWYWTRESADSALAAAAAGATWPELMDARYPEGSDPRVKEQFLAPKNLLISSPDSLLKSWFAGAAEGEMFGPRLFEDRWWIYQFLTFKDGVRDRFEDARFFVEQDLLTVESDRLLRLRLDELREGFEIEINSQALDALELPGPSTEVRFQDEGFQPQGETSSP